VQLRPRRPCGLLARVRERGGSAVTRSSAAARACATSPRRRRAGNRWSAISPTTTPHGLSRPCNLPEDGTGPAGEPVPRRGRPDPVRTTPRQRRSDPRRCRSRVVAACAAGPGPALVGRNARTRATHSGPDGLRDIGSRGQGVHSARATRFQIVLSHERSDRRRPRRWSCTARCAVSILPRIYSCSSSTAFALIGSSPETLVKCEGRRAGVNPIAGTTERGEGDAGASSHPRRTALST